MALGLNFARRPFRDYRPVYLFAAACLIFGSLLLALNIRDYTDFSRRSAGALREVQALERQAGNLQASASTERARLSALQLADLRAESLQLNTILRERRFSWLHLLSSLERALPGDVYVVSLAPSIRPDGSANLALRCVGKGPESIVRTLAALARDPRFDSAVPQSEEDPEKGQPEGFRFALSVHYTPAPVKPR